MSDTTTLAQALLAFQADAPAVHFDATNPHFGSKFASLAGVVAAVRPALNKHGLVYTQPATNLDGAPALRTTLIHAASGQQLDEVTPLVLAKNDPQGYGSALTYARRYALLSILGLVGDDDDDANAAQPKPTTNTGQPAFSQPQVRDPDPHGLQTSNAGFATTAGDPGSVILTFGKHKDKPIRDVPREYLQWYMAQEPPKNDVQKRQRAAVELFLLGATEGTLATSADDDIPFAPTVTA